MPRRSCGCPPGKLRAVARAWASGRGGRKERADDKITQSAVLPDWILEREAAQRDSEIEFADGDADSVGLFMALDTQWRWHPMVGARLGIDYSAVRPTAELLGIALDPARMTDLRLMEAAALDELAKIAARERRR